MNYRIFIASDVGSVRTNNEDAIAASGGLGEVRPVGWHSEQRGGCWVAIADGIGGSPAGELASELAVRMFASIVDRLTTADEIRRSLAAIDDELRSTGEQLPGARGMGTTFGAVRVRQDVAWAVNLGDSRIYLHRDATLAPLSTDHSDGHYLTGYLGGRGPTQESPEITSQELVAGDTLLLCSDGLTNMVTDDEIATLLTGNSDNPAHVLVRAALAAGGIDNVTVAVIRCEQETDSER